MVRPLACAKIPAFFLTGLASPDLWRKNDNATFAETQLAELTAWLAAFSQDEPTPLGNDFIIRGPYGELVSVGLDDVPPVAPEGCLHLLTLVPGFLPTGAAPEGQPRLADRAQHVAWLAGAGRGFPAVVAVAAGQTMRQAFTAAGIDPDGDIVGIPEICLVE